MSYLLHSIAWHVGGIVAPVLVGGIVALYGLHRLKRSFRRVRGDR